MPALSQAQQKAAGAALSAKRGETPVASLKGASLEMYNTMSTKELEELAQLAGEAGAKGIVVAGSMLRNKPRDKNAG